MILHLFGFGDIFAEGPVFSGIPHYPTSSLCLEALEVLAIDGVGFKTLVHKYSDIFTYRRLLISEVSTSGQRKLPG